MSAFGLDMSDSWIRLAQLTNRGSTLRLAVRAEIPVTTGSIIDGEIQNPKAVSSLLTRVVQAADLHTRQAIVSLPERHTFIKLIALDTHSQVTDDTIRAEAAQHLPYTWEEIYFDWQSLTAKNSLGQTQVLIGAAPRRLVDTYLSVLNQAGIQPISLDIESVAIARATLRPEQLSGAHIVLDLGQSRSTLILVQDGVVQFSATVRYAGKELNRFIADELHITEPQAERAKRLFGLDPQRGQGILSQVLTPTMEALAAKVKDVAEFYQDHFIDHQPLSSLILTGNGALMRNITHPLSEHLTIPVLVQPSSVYQNLIRQESDLLPDLAFTYTTAFGLALAGTSIHP